MTTPAQPLRASPLQIEKHEFLDVEVHVAEASDAHSDLGLAVKRTHAQHHDDPYRWRVELTVDFGREKDGKPSVYYGRVRVAGFFRIHAKYPQAKVADLVEVSGAAILYGACREMLATVTARASQGMLSLPSVSFAKPRETVARGTPTRPSENPTEKTPGAGTPRTRAKN